MSSPSPRDGFPPPEPQEPGTPPGTRPEPGTPPASGPLGLRTRKRAYFIMMGVCLALIVLAWMVVDRFSIPAAVIMSVIALVIPPFAAIVGNAGPANRQ
jgi:Protein of unknown function (DUF3099)